MHRILFSIGPVTVYSYGFFVALGFLIPAIFLLKAAKRENIDKNDIFDILFALLIGGVAGGRILFVIINWKDYAGSPLRAFLINEGGLAFQGALVSAFFCMAAVVAFKKMEFWKTIDLFAPYAALGHAIGRIGCFFNGCCYGAATKLPIGVTFPGDVVKRIPTQIISSALLMLLFVFLLMIRKNKPFQGYVFSIYLMLYSVQRFFIDFLRDDNPGVIFGLTLGQLISVGLFLAGVGLFVGLKGQRYRIKGGGWHGKA